MNVILGRDYLPTGALPVTSVVTTVRYGSRPRAVVHRRGGSPARCVAPRPSPSSAPSPPSPPVRPASGPPPYACVIWRWHWPQVSPPDTPGPSCTAAAALRHHAEDMRSYVLKREALRAGLITGEEAGAYLAVLHVLAGHPALARATTRSNIR
jgi:hypothetical protein